VSLVVLMSGGVDSSLVAMLALDQGVEVIPLFIDYGQLARDAELAASQRVCTSLGLPQPLVMDVHGFGKTVPSGLTDSSRRINEDAFLPGRNLLFVLAGAAVAHSRGASGVAIGLLDDSARLFPDQSSEFVEAAERMIAIALGSPIKVLAPLMTLSKADSLALAGSRGLEGTYSCHAGTAEPCGKCVSCVEAIKARELMEASDGR
jgi:7-cyano-7-deazaguanine synthase